MDPYSTTSTPLSRQLSSSFLYSQTTTPHKQVSGSSFLSTSFQNTTPQTNAASSSQSFSFPNIPLSSSNSFSFSEPAAKQQRIDNKQGITNLAPINNKTNDQELMNNGSGNTMNPNGLNAALVVEDIEDVFSGALTERQAMKAPREMIGAGSWMQAHISNGVMGVVDFTRNVHIRATQMAFANQNTPQNAPSQWMMGSASQMQIGRMGLARPNNPQSLLAGMRMGDMSASSNSQMSMGQQGFPQSHFQFGDTFDIRIQNLNSDADPPTPTGRTDFARRNTSLGITRENSNLGSGSQVPAGQLRSSRRTISSDIKTGNSRFGSNPKTSAAEHTGFRQQNPPQNNSLEMEMRNRSVGSMSQTSIEQIGFMRPNRPPAVGMRNLSLTDSLQTSAGRREFARQSTSQNGLPDVRMPDPSFGNSPHAERRQPGFVRRIAPQITPSDRSLRGAIAAIDPQVPANRPSSAQQSPTPQATAPNNRTVNSNMTGNFQSPPGQTACPRPCTPNILSQDKRMTRQPAARAMTPGLLGFPLSGIPTPRPENVQMRTGLNTQGRTISLEANMTKNRRPNPQAGGLQQQQQQQERFQLRHPPSLFNLNRLQAHPWPVARAILPGPDIIYPSQATPKPAPPLTIHDFEEAIRRHVLAHSILSSVRLSNSNGADTTPLDVENGIRIKMQRFEMSLGHKRPLLEDRERLDMEMDARTRPLMFADFVRGFESKEGRFKRMRAAGKMSDELESEVDAEEVKAMEIDETFFEMKEEHVEGADVVDFT